MTATTDLRITIGPRVRKSPFFDATLRHGARSFTIYNHMYMPTGYSDPVTEYWSLVRDVTLWDVACQRQVEVSGPDALRLIQWLTPRDMSGCAVGQCRYTLLCDERGGIVNDAVMLKLAEDRYWLSPGDGDVLLWAQGAALNAGLEVTIDEPDVSPLQLQGPKAPQVARALFGAAILDLKYYWATELDLDGIPLVVSRTGWSGELGYELYLRDGTRGDALWERVMHAGRACAIAPITPSTIRSIEGGLLSYASDLTRRDDPFVMGVDKLVDLQQDGAFIGRAALARIAAQGPQRRLAGIEIGGTALASSNHEFWPVLSDGEPVGHVTRCAHSPRLEKNIGFANLPLALAGTGTRITVATPQGEVPAITCAWPWFPAQTAIPR